MNHQGNYPLNDTIVALSTPVGKGAIGIIRLSGPDAIKIVDKIFKGKQLLEQKSQTIHFGKILNEEKKLLDEVLISLFIAPHSYTSENIVEISCHGSSYILQETMQLLIRMGARMAQAGEFTFRAFINGRIDLSQAEAVADLIAANSAAAHALAMGQMRGGISDEIKKLRQQLLDLASLLELELDFSEEDVEFADRSALKALVLKIQSLMQSLIQSFALGNAIKKGVHTVIAGRPNAGKSTLLNALLQEERAIVSDIAGTTRDVIEEILNINGIEFRLIDTAGIRDAQNQIEAMGIEKTIEKIQQSAILIYVFDASQSSPESIHEDLAKLQQPNQVIILVPNKMDLNPYLRAEAYISEWVSKENIVTASALNNMNIGYLKEKLYQTVHTEKITPDSPIVSNIRHLEGLQNAYDSLTNVLSGLETGLTSDLIAVDIRQTLYYLGEIVGEVSNDDLLGNIFSKFCIGK